MKSNRTLLLVFFLLTTVAAGVFAFRQYEDKVALTGRLSDPKTGLETELAAARKEIRELRDQLALSRRTAAASAAAARQAAKADTGPADDGPPNRGQGRRAAFEAIISNPQFQALRAVQAKSQLDVRYADLFKALVSQYGVSPAQIDQFKSLLVQRQQAQMDAIQAARQNGIDPRTDRQAFQDAIAAATSDLDGQMKSTLGDAGYTQYQQFDQTARERATVSQLQQSLSYSAAPLSDSQAQQLVTLLQQQSQGQGQNVGGRGFGGIGEMGFGGGPFGGGQVPAAPVSTQVVAQAAGFLNPSQVQALQQLQQSQQATQQMQQIMQSAFQGGNRRKGG